MRKPPLTVPEFDRLVYQLSSRLTSFDEAEVLETLADLGFKGRLSDDIRFRPTPWGRWLLSKNYLANDALHEVLRNSGRSEIALTDELESLSKVAKRPCVFCPKDPRLVLGNGILRLAASELSAELLLEDPTQLEKFTTHLPVHTLEAVAASEPLGQWGTVDWLRTGAGRELSFADPSWTRLASGS